MFILRRILRVDPESDHSKGQEAYNQRKYARALKHFERAFKRYDDLNKKLVALDNAAVCAEKASTYEKASLLYYQAIILKLANQKQQKEISLDIDRTIRTLKLSENPPISINKILFMKFLMLLSEKEFEKLETFYKKLRIGTNDEFSEAIEKTWSLIHSADTFVNKVPLPMTDLPVEYSAIIQKAEKIMQRCSLCEVSLNDLDSSEVIQKGGEFSLPASLTAHAPVSISSINLKTGARGRILSSTIPELPLNMSTGENYAMVFSLIPNLPGDWEIGPLSLSYSIPSESGVYLVSSNRILLVVKEAAPALKLSMEFDTIEEDYEYLIRLTAENSGKIALQNVRIHTDIPDAVKIHEGTSDKIISTLVEGEIFQYQFRIRFAPDQTHFKGHVLRANGFIEDNHRLAKCSIKLGGK